MLIAILMGSENDWVVMKNAATTLKDFGIPFEARVISAHRTPELLVEFLQEAEKKDLKAVIAGAGSAAHLAGVCAAHTLVPVYGVPIDASPLQGLDALLATVQMPGGIPVATFAIGAAGAKNAALSVVAMLANFDPALKQKLRDFRQKQAEKVKSAKLSLD